MKKKLIRHISNIPGRKIKGKILVLESDDWGSIRMPSKEVCDTLYDEGIPVYDNFFSANDGLESNQDLENLFEILSSVKDKNGNSAVMTPLVIMANPDFQAIESEKFKRYFYEPFTETAKAYKDSDRILNLWKEGKSRNLFVPEFHGREHLNLNRWMKGLREDLPQTKRLFSLKMFGIHSSMVSEKRKEYFPAFDIDKPEDIKDLKDILKEGIELFRKMLGYYPRYLVPPNGPFNNNLEPYVKSLGIDYINTAKIQKEPLGDDKFKKNFHFFGQKSKAGLYYLTRNVIFEPSQKLSKSSLDNALKDISIAFRWQKPAVISSHRVNYVSRISHRNRDEGLRQLHDLLRQAIKIWPDIEFKTSTQLGDIISKN